MTQSLWRKIQELGLAVDYKENSQLRAWFDLFKGLAFVPLNLIELAFNIILDSKPLKNEKIDLFIKYFTSTWFSTSCMFPPHIWNHYETVGPKTNNHVEGFNFKLNQYSFSSHPNIYQLVQLFKQMETVISQKYIKRMKGLRLRHTEGQLMYIGMK